MAMVQMLQVCQWHVEAVSSARYTFGGSSNAPAADITVFATVFVSKERPFFECQVVSQETSCTETLAAISQGCGGAVLAFDAL
jgi:hypothetical protein